MSTSRAFRGVFAIPPTPFTDDGGVDYEGLNRCVDFCVAAGAHGIVAPVNASEFWTLTDDERKAVAQTIIARTAGRAMTMIGVQGTSIPHAVLFAKHAQSIGADSVIAMPPYVRTASPAMIIAYYTALNEAIDIPICIQNHDPPGGTRMTPEFVARLVNELEHVVYIKEETYPPQQAITAELALCGESLGGVMGGIAGRYLLEEYARGGCGTMPACEVADVHVQVWEALEAGDDRTARDLMNALLPLLNYEAMYGAAVYKEVLRRRGVIASNYMRSHAGNPLDAANGRELDALLADLRPLFRTAPPS
jgi:dihydrodipicolinate synthase/N-acetylneuraminate lyase